MCFMLNCRADGEKTKSFVELIFFIIPEST